MMRLKAKDRRELVDWLRRMQRAKVVNSEGLHLGWYVLTCDHERRLWDALRPWCDRPARDRLTQAVLLDDFGEAEYTRHYNDDQINRLLVWLLEAQRGLSWLEGVLTRERFNRQAKKQRKAAHRR